MLYQPCSLILLCGLPGVGKTLATAKLMKELTDFVLIDQNQIRRDLKYTTSPVIIHDDPRFKDRDIQATDKMLRYAFQTGKGVVYDSVNRLNSRRHQLYGIASSWEAQVIVLEIVCPEEISKSRIRTRPDGDGLLSDPNDPAIYDKVKIGWDSVEEDFKDMILSHVSHIRYDSYENKLVMVIKRKESENMISQINAILTNS